MLAALLGALTFAAPAVAEPTELFFSEYVEGSSNNKALEIYNGTAAAVPLAGYDVQMCFNGNPTCTLTIALSGTIAPGDVFVLAHSSAAAAILAQADQTNGSGWFNGDDAVLLRKGGTVVDSIGQRGFDPGTQWGTGDASTENNTLRRAASVEAGDAVDTDAFDPATEWAGFPQDTFDGLGAHSLTPPPPSTAPTLTCGGTLNATQGFAASRTVTATDGEGRVVAMALQSVTPATSGIALTGFTASPAAGEAASATLQVADALAPGTYAVTVSATDDDATPKTATCTFDVVVTQVRTIGEVQGPVLDTTVGSLHRSAFAPPSGNSAGQTVTVRGVITQKTLALESDGDLQNGFFIQSTAATSDGDPLTSDGIFVFMGGFTSLIGGYLPQVGDEVVISGRVVEFFNLTQLSSARLVQLVGSFLDVPTVAPAFEVDPPADFAGAERYWERREGMQARVPAGSLSVDGMDSFPSTFDAEQWLVRGDSEVALRADAYARRVFRDAHPLDDEPGLVDNGNGYRFMVAALGVKATAGDPQARLTPARTFDRLDNDLVGGVYFSFSKYGVQTANQPSYTQGVDPSANHAPTAFVRALGYTVADYNVENLYDYRDDPFDGCDFAGNAGCPGVRPPFDYVPSSDAVYQARLGEIAQQIVGDLHSPDLLLVQEAEDQDICTVEAGALACGTTDGADGKPDTLQELAVAIAAAGGPAYDAAYDRDGSDDRGIVAALMYRTDRVQLLAADAAHPVLGATPAVVYPGTPKAYNTDVQNPKALNAALPAGLPTPSGRDGDDVYTRDPQVGLFRVWRNGVGRGTWVDVAALSEHFSSTPNGRMEQRREQARYSAAIVDALEDGGLARVVVGGDFNVYPRPDDPVSPPSDQLGPLYDQGLENLFDVVVAERPSAAYSYVFQGQTQTLDGQFVTDRLRAELRQARVAHVNADFPADTAGDGPRGLSDHDPLVARFALPATIDGLTALLGWWYAEGAIEGENTLRQLQHHLEQARKVGDAQLRAFANQVRGKSPRWIAPEAADALVAEAELLISTN